MDLNKHIVNSDNKPFHSSGIAEAANAGQIGSTSHVSFEARQVIESRRKLVGGYNRSSIGSTYNKYRAKPVVRGASRGVARSASRPAGVVQPRKFSEPRSRGFNPYA